MLDFVIVSTATPKKGVVEVFPKFIIKKSADLMTRGGDFYAIWDEERGLWSTDEQDVVKLVDREIDIFVKKNKKAFGEDTVHVLHMWDAGSGMIDRWHKYCQKQLRDNFKMLDHKIIFSNDPVRKTDYASHRLNYPLQKGDFSAYDKLVGVLYSPEERHKIEWAIGSIVCGDSRILQKFLVLYGEGGTGKSTMINIILKLFDGYSCVFDAKALGSSSHQFALESFRNNPLVAVQHDGDLSKIEDNTRLNSLVSHEEMIVNEKHKTTYSNRFGCFLVMGTNKPVKITDAKSGIIRRLIDVSPTGEKLPLDEYNRLFKQIDFELGAIAWHCREVYLENPSAYDNYIPLSMISASNDFFNYILDSWSVFVKDDKTTLKSAWERYRVYCDDAKVPYPMSQRAFKEELKNYFREYRERVVLDDGTRVRSLYKGFRTDKFDENKPVEKGTEPVYNWLDFTEQPSVFDAFCRDVPAQYANSAGTPNSKWEKVATKLCDLDTTKLHYVKFPEEQANHIVIDFDIPDENGKKSFELNRKAAEKFPKTYGELSKSGEGIHLHYIFDGDVSRLAKLVDEHIEIKIFTGGSSLRRKLTKCNNLDISHISSGLPLTKGEKKMIDEKVITNEKAIRTLIKRNLAKEYHADTKSSIDFIAKSLNDIYESGESYDVSDLKNDIIAFAAGSTNQSDYCLKAVKKMKFKSEESPPATDTDKPPLVFFDVEVFPNLFLVNYEMAGEGNKVVRMINPTPEEIEGLLKYRLVGFNCRRYDNHILYARLMGYTNEQLFKLSQKIITEGKGFFGEAYNISYTDIYDFSSVKQSLKKFEIDLGIHHQELGLPWDKPVPESKWVSVAEYCDNDVLATETVFNHPDRQADFTARQILADLAGMTVNDTTNSLTTRIIFGKNRKPQDEFIYRDLAKPVKELDDRTREFLEDACPNMMKFPHGKADSLLPYFEGYEYKDGVSTYCGEEVGEGGYVYAQPGIYRNVALLDISSMHPHSVISECLFGSRFTRVFKELVDARVAIKHEDWDAVSKMLDGKLIPYVERVKRGEMTSKSLANALKIAINSVYGLTAAKFENAFRDLRNVDNIVAKRGALFMVNLKHAVQERGFTVAHIKTDSIKIPDATPEIIHFVNEYGKRYGYSFEHEATYERMCLVNDAVYIAKYLDGEECQKLYNYIPDKNQKKAGKWDATGTQFQVPYVFKTLFSKEPIEFGDLCETKAVSSALYLDMNESLPDVSEYEKEYKKLWDDNMELICNPAYSNDEKAKDVVARIDELDSLIEKGHNRVFVGKVGLFCPVKPGTGGGELLREAKDKNGGVTYVSATGAKGYRWVEAEMLKASGKEGDIDRSYYDRLVDTAVEAISKYGDFDEFVNGKIAPSREPPPFGRGAAICGREHCEGCENFTIEGKIGTGCKIGYDEFPF